MINDWEDTGSTGSSFYVQPARMIYIDAAGLICVTRPARFMLRRHV